MIDLPPEYVERIREREARAALTKRSIYGVRNRWRAYLWTAYRLTIEEYDQLVLDQGGRCALCNRPSDLFVDHCHDTGRVRGLLCPWCNGALGVLGDSLDSIKAVLAYLAEPAHI